MSTTGGVSASDAAARARTWRHRTHDAICDVRVPWPAGTILRASRYPSFFDFNLVRVERDPGMSVDELVGVADRALAGLSHRRLDIEPIEVGERLRAGLSERGWSTYRLVWMRHEGARPNHPPAVREVAYDVAHDLRVAWHAEDFPGQDHGGYFREEREVALRRGARVLAVFEAGAPVGFAQVERDGDGAELTHVYVGPRFRGAGRGAALTRAAISAAGSARDVWIAADDEGDAKRLYARLGFQPAWTALECTRWPSR